MTNEELGKLEAAIEKASFYGSELIDLQAAGIIIDAAKAHLAAQRQGGIGKPVQYTDGSDSREYEVHPPAVTGDRAAALDALAWLNGASAKYEYDNFLRHPDVFKHLETIRAALTNSALDGALQKAIEALRFYADDAKYCGIIKEIDGATVFEWPMYRDHGTTAKEALRELEPWVKGVE